MIKRLATYCVFLVLLISFGKVNGQGISVLPEVINRDTTIVAGEHLAKKNILISEEAVLNCKPGVKLMLEPGVVIRVEGGIIMQGEPGNFCEVTSFHENKPGSGILITDQTKNPVKFQYTRFHKLNSTLDFAQHWHRPNVFINACEFSNNTAFEPCLVVRVPDNIYVREEVNFIFINSVFVNNFGGIHIENITHSGFNFKFSNNLIHRNWNYGAAPEGLLTSPFFTKANYNKLESGIQIQSNAFFDNYILDSEYDTIVQEMNFGIAGEATKIQLPNNYFGKGSIATKANRIDHFTNNKNSPYLDISPDLKELPPALPALIEHLYVNGEKVTDIPNYKMNPEDDIKIRLSFSGPVDIASCKPKVSYYHIKKGSKEVVEVKVETTAQWQDDKTAEFNLEDSTLADHEAIFFSLRGFKDPKGFNIPDVHLGENQFYRYVANEFPGKLQNLRKSVPPGRGMGDEQSPLDPKLVDSLLKELAKMKGQITKHDQFMEEDSAERAFFQHYRHGWEYGFYVGESIYFGDLTGNDIFDPKDARFSFGLSLGYNVSNRSSVRFTLLRGTLQGDETDDERGTKWADRGLRFYSPLYEAALHYEFNLNKIGLGDQGRFTPTFSAGIGAFYFHPQLYVDSLDNFVSLYRIGTTGQWHPDNKYDFNRYNLFSISIPVGFHLKFVIKKRWIADAFVSWRYTFTDNIDDVGGQLYPESVDDLKAQHPLDKTFREIVDNAAAPNPNYFKPGIARGNANITDWYIITGIRISKLVNLRKYRVQE